MRRAAKISLQVAAALVVLILIGALAGLLVVQSGWFHEYVRGRIIAEIEHATGGKVDLGRFSFRGPTLTATLAPLVLHGKEGPGEAPLLQIESVTLGLRVISVLEHKVDLASARVQKPLVHILFYPDGTTNIPSPAESLSGKSWAQQLIDLAVARYEVNDGLIVVDEERVPLNLRGEGLNLRLTYDTRTPAYRGDVSTRMLRVLPGGLAPIEVGMSSQFVLDRNRLNISALRLSTRESRVDLTGALENLRAPRGNFNLRATGSIREAVQLFRVPLQPEGSAQFDGKLAVSFGSSFDFEFNGKVNGRGLGFAQDRIRIAGADVRADLNLRTDKVTLRNVHAAALGATFEGSSVLEKWRQLHVEGNLDGLTVADAAKFVTDRSLPWNGVLSGPVSLDNTLGQRDLKARADLSVAPAPNGAAIQGRIDAAYDQQATEISLGSSFLTTAATRADVSGTLGRTLQVQFRTTNPDDVLPALAFVEENPPREIPLKLAAGGTIVANGTVTGRLETPRFQGHVDVVNGTVNGHGFEHFSGDVDATRAAVSASKISLARGATEVTGTASIAERQDSFEDGAIEAQLNIHNVNLAEALKEAGSSLAVTGAGGGTVRVTGTVRQYHADATLDVDKPAGFGESLDRLRATVRVEPGKIDVSSAEAQSGPDRVRLSGSYASTAQDWRTGDLRVDANTQNLAISRIQKIAALKPAVNARVSGEVHAAGRVAASVFTLTSASGNISAQQVSVASESIGDISLTAETRGTDVSIQARGKIEDAPFQGDGVWKLDGDNPGTANVRFSRMSIDSVHRLAMLGGLAPHQDQPDLPFEGFVEGSARVTVALRKPDQVQAEVTLQTVQLSPNPKQKLPQGVTAQDITVRNTQPVALVVNSREARISTAQFTARGTSIEATGAIPFTSSGGADISVRGTVDLALLQLIEPDLTAKGNASVLATVRGTLAKPQVNGRMELKGASLYLNDVSSGIDNASGVVTFDRSRATIERMTAELGGGTISLGGFMDLDPALTYRLQGTAREVRVRNWLEGLSVTADAQVALTGTPEASTISGMLTLNRAAFDPRTDLVQVLASAAKPAPAPSAPNEYLRGVQFDVRIQSSPTFELQTSLTRDLEAEVDLRLRGSPLRPVLLGTVSVNQGEVEILGNRYTIDRGDIRFLNPVKIEPNFDMNLETKARGVTVNISFSGTLDKLRPNYSSDPPLQTSEIIALLAVGRDPSGNPGLAAAQVSGSSSSFVAAGGSLLSQAVSAQLSSRLQRFFGATRVKIDPTMTDIANLPQARLTFEQQVSRDITLTYITNLNYTQEQIVRLQWDLNRNWSAIAVRDANGLFGVDFQYRKRFK